MLPARFRLSRKLGARLPPDVVRVDRATHYGNPFVCRHGPALAVAAYRAWLAGDDAALRHLRGQIDEVRPTHADARQRVLDGMPSLRGRRLACWCAPDSPCHADVLLELAHADAEAAVG
jgi:hypothetical protein